MKNKLQFFSNDIEDDFRYFQNFETLENIFKIQYAWEDGSFDSEIGILDLNTVKYKGIIYTKPLLLTAYYNTSPRVSPSEAFTKISVQPQRKHKNDI